jgi:fumarate reductase flavoprotein subunit
MKTKEMDRRAFLKAGTFAGAIILSGSTLTGCSPDDSGAQQKGTIEWDEYADIIIVGGGGAGFCAAIEAADTGSSVLILEKNAYCGGSTALSGGMILAAKTDWQVEIRGFADDDPADFAKQQIGYGGGLIDAGLVEEMCLQSGEAVRFMTDLGRIYTAVDIVPPIWDYDKDLKFPAAPRSHWDMQSQSGHFVCLQDKLATYNNVTIATGTEVQHLIKDGKGEIIGVQAGDKYYRADKAVILATAAIDNDIDMARRYSPQEFWGLTIKAAGNAGPTQLSPTNTGDGIRMGIEVGADLALSTACVMANKGYYGGVGTEPYSTYEHEPNPYSSSSLIGEILVNGNGDRFLQEDAEWGYVCSRVYQENVRTGGSTVARTFAVTDSSNLRRWEAFGLSHDFEAATIEGLAEVMGVPTDRLVATVERWNTISREKSDPDFGRRTDFGEITMPPFYAMYDYVTVMGSAGGLRVNTDTQVLDPTGNPISRLYAAGMVAGGWCGPFYAGCGWAILGTVHWGRKAGQKAAALEPIA